MGGGGGWVLVRGRGRVMARARGRAMARGRGRGSLPAWYTSQRSSRSRHGLEWSTWLGLGFLGLGPRVVDLARVRVLRVRAMVRVRVSLSLSLSQSLRLSLKPEPKPRPRPKPSQTVCSWKRCAAGALLTNHSTPGMAETVTWLGLGLGLG